MRALVASILSSRTSLVAVCAVLAACGPAAGAPGTVCDGARPCAGGGACLVGRCRAADTTPWTADTARLVLPPADLAVVTSRGGSDERAPDAISLGRASVGSVVVLLRYEPRWREEAEIEGAFLVLDPLDGAPPAQSAVRVDVARVLEPWASDSASWGRQPRLAMPEVGAIVRPAPPSPLRIDVTDVVREWAGRYRKDHGLALLASGDDPFGAVFATGVGSGRPPSLEVYLR